LEQKKFTVNGIPHSDESHRETTLIIMPQNKKESSIFFKYCLYAFS